MERAAVVFTVFFEEPFWVGVLECTAGGKLKSCKHTFGAESKDNEVMSLIEGGYYRFKFSPSVKAETEKVCRNPKRLQRQVRRQVSGRGTGTKSMQALSRQREEMKTEKKCLRKEEKEAEKERMFELKRQKKKEKHRGR